MAAVYDGTAGHSWKVIWSQWWPNCGIMPGDTRERWALGNYTPPRKLAILAEVEIVNAITASCLSSERGPKRRRRKREIYLFLGQSYAIHRRYTEHPLLCVPYGSLQGAMVRPVPCNYYVIQQVSALLRR